MEENKKNYEEEDDDADAFMEGYMDEEEVQECDECGSAIRDSPITKEVDGEKRNFCSKVCADEFEETMG